MNALTSISMRAGCLVAAGGLALTACSSSSPTTLPSDATVPSTVSGAGVPAVGVAGAWDGTLTGNTGGTFKINATVDDTLMAGQQGGAVDYPDLGKSGCSGQWVFNELNGNTFHFTETIDEGSDKECKGTGKVKLTAGTDNTVTYSWSDGTETSKGTLSELG